MKHHIKLHYTGPLGGWYAEVPTVPNYRTVYYATSQLPWLYRDLAWWLE